MACCNKKGLWRVIAGMSLVTSCFYIGASICGLLTYYCVFNPDVSQFQMNNFYLTYVSYFYNYDCIDTESNYLIWTNDPSERTWAIMIAYIILHTVWFFTSVLLFLAPKYWNTRTVLFMTYPWLFSIFAVLCLDLACSIIYGLDYEDVEDLQKLVKFATLSYPGLEEDSKYFTYFPALTVIMVALCSKFVIGWLLLLISAIYIFVSLNISAKPQDLVLQTRPNVDYYAPPGYANPTFEMREVSTMDYVRSSAVPAEFQWEAAQLGQVPQLIPRAKLDDHRQKQRMPYPSDSDTESWGQDLGSNPPRSILKTPKTIQYAFEDQQPWSYFPQSSNSQNSPPQRQSQESWAYPQASAPVGAQYRNSTQPQSMYY